ncbi:hypothetical protein Y032_0095g2815 [Ancylostoma ceylanicum]|uniref:Uncharacterized protein n=1 Tax=Ancylostoma ceylanicum TaxID=53326 RepID=A0A016TKH8_9BILA|nr:hypothetical protein Y032_0095g2815 [Ancylostoma ceylanicum]
MERTESGEGNSKRVGVEEEKHVGGKAAMDTNVPLEVRWIGSISPLNAGTPLSHCIEPASKRLPTSAPRRTLIEAGDLPPTL